MKSKRRSVNGFDGTIVASVFHIAGSSQALSPSKRFRTENMFGRIFFTHLRQNTALSLKRFDGHVENIFLISHHDKKQHPW